MLLPLTELTVGRSPGEITSARNGMLLIDELETEVPATIQITARKP